MARMEGWVGRRGGVRVEEGGCVWEGCTHLGLGDPLRTKDAAFRRSCAAPGPFPDPGSSSSSTASARVAYKARRVATRREPLVSESTARSNSAQATEEDSPYRRRLCVYEKEGGGDRVKEGGREEGVCVCVGARACVRAWIAHPAAVRV